MNLDRPVIDIKIPHAFRDIYKPARYKVYYGGRGSAKSHSVARYILWRCLKSPIRVLCAREFQNSIQESVHQLFSELIRDLNLQALFKVQQSTIVSYTGSEIFFKGIAHNVEGVKSTESIDICWVEEAETVSNKSWDILGPTIRKPGSEIIITFNPRFEYDPTYQRFIVNCPPNTVREKVNHDDNPHFPDVLQQEMEHMRATDYERYLWIWEGYPRSISDAQIFKGKCVVTDFSSEGVENFRFGADFGFAKDPATLIRCFIRDADLFIDYEGWGYGVELKDLPTLYRTVPLSNKYEIRGDSSRPETIAFLKRPENGSFKMLAAEKWPSSVEEGIEFLRSFRRIVIHPRCKHMIFESTAYSYKVDKRTEEILPIPVDAHNHGWDAVRYACEPLIKQKATIYQKGVVK